MLSLAALTVVFMLKPRAALNQWFRSYAAAHLHDERVAIAYLLRQPCNGLPLTHQQHLVRTKVHLTGAATAQQSHIVCSVMCSSDSHQQHLVRTKVHLTGGAAQQSHAVMRHTRASLLMRSLKQTPACDCTLG
jgi:hypothetical protein